MTDRIGVIVLAAGASRRMGQPKALLSLAGQTLLHWVCASARAICATEVIVAIAEPHGASLRAEVTRLAEALPLVGLRWAWNDAPERGMLSSVQCALASVSADIAGVLIWPVDIPRVGRETLRAVVRSGLSQERLVVPTHEGRGGHPLWLPRALFAAALSLPVEQGLRALRQQHPPLLLAVEDKEVLRDLDTPQDVQDATRG